MAFYSLDGKDINASDPEWWKYSDKVVIPEGVKVAEMSHYYAHGGFCYYHGEKNDFMRKLYKDSENSQANLEHE